MPNRIDFDTLAATLSPLAREALLACRDDLGEAQTPGRAYLWARSAGADTRKPIERQLALSELADRLAWAALEQMGW